MYKHDNGCQVDKHFIEATDTPSKGGGGGGGGGGSLFLGFRHTSRRKLFRGFTITEYG